jgi:hypothetical protein
MLQKGERIFVAVTRFNDLTYSENVAWRKKHKWQGCIYGSGYPISPNIPKNSLIFVIEMNNEQNKIMGIGAIRNRVDRRQEICVYRSDTCHNRYIYQSGRRVDRDDIRDRLTLFWLERLVFKGAGHYKRGRGISRIPWKRFGGKQHKKFIYSFVNGLFEVDNTS